MKIYLRKFLGWVVCAAYFISSGISSILVASRIKCTAQGSL
ncbi:MAG: hypothetical protein HZC49_06215 [Nitrospirae bacterium]|nr:hypothetical protein [Nitrospirota bacterium]